MNYHILCSYLVHIYYALAFKEHSILTQLTLSFITLENILYLYITKVLYTIYKINIELLIYQYHYIYIIYKQNS